MCRILLAEDDDSLGYILKEYLELHRFRTELAKDGEAALQLFNDKPFDICILDVMLPKRDGFAVAAEMRQSNRDIPFIFLTARSLKVDKLKGFNIGADDYIVKPVDEEELIARINAVLNRMKNVAGRPDNNHFKIGSYTFDYGKQLLKINGHSRTLTVRETELLKLLCESRSRILDRKQALKVVWGETDYFARRSMDVFISRLRKYFSEDTGITIRNIHGKGYVFEWREEEA